MVHLILDRIRKVRIEKNLSQSDLAYQLNITQSSYAKMEKGEIKLSLNNLISITEYLKINLASLFDSSKNEDSFNDFKAMTLEDKIQEIISQNVNNDLAEIKKMIIEMKQNK